MKRIVLTEEELNEQRVVLKPIFGIQPETYIKYVYALLIAVIFFAVFFLPGILKNGTYYRFSSTPQGASVTVDGIRLGGTPGTYFVARGEREITLKSPYHEALTQTVKVKGRVFGSLFLKRTRDYAGAMVFNIDEQDLYGFHQEAASWFQSDEGYSSQPLPPLMTSLTRGFYLSTENHSNLTDQDIRDFNLSLLRAVNQGQSYRDWQKSASLYLTRGKALNPGSYLKAVAEGARLMTDNPEIFSILKNYHTLPAGIVTDSSRKQELFGVPAVTVSYQPDPDDPLRFRPVGTLTEGNQVYDIFAADREITKGWYSLFLDDNPDWALPSLESLISRRLADDSYLSDWDTPIVPSRTQEPMRFVSLYAAEEFCKWLEETYFSADGMTVRLPDEWEWEELAIKNGLNNSDRPSQKNLGPLEAGSFLSGELKLYDMDGNLWEWCGNEFGLNDALLRGSAEVMAAEMPFPDAAVRGGSWANTSGQVNGATRGSQPKSWCTAYVGFRPLLIVKRK